MEANIRREKISLTKGEYRGALRGLAFCVEYMTEIVIFAGYYNTDLL